MSLINQMLRDLDRQRGPAGDAQLSVLHSLGLAGTDRASRDSFRTAVFAAVAAVLSVALIWWMLGTAAIGHTTGTGAALVRQPLSLPPPQPLALGVRAHKIPHPARLSTENGATVGLEGTRQSMAAVEPVSVAPPASTLTNVVPKPGATVQTPEYGRKPDRLFNQAQSALAHGDNDRALRLLEGALTRDPHNSVGRKQLAMLMIRDGRPGSAAELLAHGLELSPRDAELAKACAQLLVERGDLVQALNTLEAVEERPNGDPGVLALRAGILDRLQRYGESAAAYRRALRLEPGRAVWWTGLGVALDHDGQSAAALAAYRRAADLPADDAIRAFVLQRIQALAYLAQLG